jgi:hypothetical protein
MMKSESNTFMKVDQVGSVRFYLTDGRSSAADAIYRARFKLYAKEDRYIADSGIHINVEKKMIYDVFDPISLHLVALNDKDEIFCGIRLVPYNKEIGLPMENRYPDKSTQSGAGFNITHYIENSGILVENIAEFGRFFRLTNKKNVDTTYDPISLLIWKNATQITKHEVGDIKPIDHAFAYAVPSLAKLYSKFGMGMIPDVSGNYTNHIFPVPTKLNTSDGRITTEDLELVPLVLSRKSVVERIRKADWEAHDPTRPRLDRQLLAHLAPEEFGLSQDEIDKQKKDLADVYEMLYGEDGPRTPDADLVISRR